MTNPEGNLPEHGDDAAKIINEARKSIKEEIKQAEEEKNSDEAKRKLGEKLRGELEQIKKEIKEIVEDKEKGGRIEESLVEEEKKSLRVLIRAAEAAKRGIPVGKTQQAQQILAMLADKELTPSSSTAIIFYLIDYLTGDKKIVERNAFTEDFINAYRDLKAIDRTAAEKVRECIDHVFPQLSEREKERLEEKDQKQRQGVLENEKRFRELFRKLNENLVENRADLTPEEFKKISNFIAGFTPEEQLEDLFTILAKIGISEQEARDYLRLIEQRKRMALHLGMLGEYAGSYIRFIQRAQEEFEVEEIKKRFFTDENGYFCFDPKKAREFKNLIQRYYFEVLQEIHSNHSIFFNEVLRDNSAAHYYFLALGQIIHDTCSKLKESIPWSPKDFQGFKEFLEDTYLRYPQDLLFFSQVFHDLPLWVRDAAENFEKWGSFLRHLFPSKIAELFDDDGLMMAVRRTIPQLIRQELVKNKNFYPTHLLGGQYSKEGVRWENQFKKKIREAVEEIAEELGIDVKGENSWRLTAALIAGEAIGILTLADVETMGTSHPEPENFKGVHALLPMLFAKFNWGIMRGGDVVGRINRYLMGMRVELSPHQRPFYKRIWSKKKWVPEEFAQSVDRKLQTLSDYIMEILYFEEASFRELLNMINMPVSLFSRHSWRYISEIWNKFKEENPAYKNMIPEEATEEDWRKIIDQALQKYGMGMVWGFLTSGPSIITSDLKKLFSKYKGRDALSLYFTEYQPSIFLPTNKALAEEFWFYDEHGERKKMSLLDIKNIRTFQRRGELFFRYLQRNPGEFFLLLSQLVPDLVDKEGYLFLTEEEIDQKEREKRQQRVATLTKQERINLSIRRNQFIQRWSKEGYEILKTIRHWVEKGAAQLTGGDIKTFIDLFTKEAMIGYQKMAKKGERWWLRPEDLRETDQGKKIGELIFGREGLISILTGATSFDQLKDYYENFGDFEHFGKDTFFYRMGKNWSIIEGDICPFSADITHFEIFEVMGLAAGEDVPARLFGDAAFHYKELIESLRQFPDILIQVAQTGDMTKIYEIHQHLYLALSSTIGHEYAQRANYIFAQVIAKFFMEHNLARDPKLNLFFPLKFLARLGLGKKISLSKIALNDIHAFSMDTNALRTYFLNLAHYYHVIPEKGAWSEEHLNRVFESTLGEYVALEVVPQFCQFLILFLLFMFIKKALEEEKKKK